MSDSLTHHSGIRRHPSAGNLNARPTLVRVGDGPVPLPPASYPHGTDLPTDTVRFGPDLDDATLAKLIGSVGTLEGRRVLDLGCGAGSAAVSLARRGARVIAVESSTARLTQARAAADLAEVKVEFHHSDLADLAFLRADSIELVMAVYSLAGVQDLGRVFRQLHRIMRPDAALVMSLPHPFSMMLELDQDEQSTPYLTRDAWSDQAVSWRAGGDEGVTHVHQISDVFTHLIRSNFRIDALIEPPPVEGRRSVHWSALTEWVPSTVILRARKEGT
jgi:ubiquinone/menaquinone biosynthesis C-methylase UbiE